MNAVAKVLAVLALGALLGACQPPQNASQQGAEPTTTEAALPAGCMVGANDAIGGPIDLVDQTGSAVTQANFAEGPALVYFGYTFCPDVCPLGLQTEKAALAKLGQEGAVVQPVLISLDPARDTPTALAAYVKAPAFPENLSGLTGNAAQIDAAAKAFRVAYTKDGEGADYTVSHTSFFYLMDDQWKLRAMFPSTLNPDDAAVCLRAGLKQQ